MQEVSGSALRCTDCGSDPIYHKGTYIALWLERFARPLFFYPSEIGRYIGERVLHAEWLLPLIYRGIARLGLGTLLDAPDEKTLLLDRVLWEEAKERGIEMQEFRLFGLPRNLFIVKFRDGRHSSFEGIPLSTRKRGPVWWIDNKAELKKRFQAYHFPVAAGGAASSYKSARHIYDTLLKPVITKPHVGSATRHTTLHISDEKKLKQAFAIAKQVSPLVVIEEELEGHVYRATLVDGKLCATIRRDPPTIIGDGHKTIQELVEKANEHPARRGPYFSPIALSQETLDELKRQTLSPQSVPPSGERITLHQKINWSVGGTTKDVSDEVHPDNILLFEEISDRLRAEVVGIDFISPDLSRSWREVRCGVIECNSMPFFDNHHLPFEGRPRNIAAKIWDLTEQR
ncbi:MAG: hypothetical protein KGJ34_00215 [Patescibacteria group bacterium]|nr:hypothetical protein [Patescibacteria group bacterium]